MDKQTKDCRLGELLVRLGLIDDTELRAMLSLQAELRAHHRSRLPGVADKRFRLGALLVQSGVVDEQALEDVLARRQRMLAQAALASAALSVLAPAAAAGDTAHVNVVATVLTRTSIEFQQLPSDVSVTEQDVARGYIDVESIEIGVQSNNPAGVRIAFVATSPQFAAVDVEGGGSTVFLAQPARGLQRQKISVRLRLRLVPGAAPGTIAYPVSVFLAPA